MDPVTAVGLAVSILSFIEKGTKIARTAYDIHQSAAGVHEDVARQEANIASLQAFCKRIRLSEHSDSDSNYQVITALAQDCERLATELIELIHQIKPKGEKSLWTSLPAAIRQRKTEHKRNAIQKQLEKYRNDIVTELGLWNHEKHHLLLAEVKRAVDSQDNSKLASFMGVIQNVEQISVTLPAYKNQMDGLLTIQADVLNHIVQLRVLKALSFDNMKQRQENVTVAHNQTFRWSLSDQNISHEGASEDREKQKARELFVDWLAHGEGIFHIHGKLGSGKSTLMKYLSDNDVTTSLLREWADGRQLVTARFFFWKPGGELQNTLAGLKRTLLHDILHDCPDLIPSVLPLSWERCKAIPWQAGDEKLDISRPEVEHAFTNLIVHAIKSKQRCFCIFIDGLDEYVGTPDCDTKHMVDELRGWARQTSQVKICVSSRPDNVFMNAFDPRQQIKLHDLTKGDMQAYIRAQLDHMESLETREKLVDLIIEKAQGIFLWVTLAVRSIREQIENGFSSADMIRNVRLLPTELEELFKHILNSLIDPHKGYRTLVMMKLAMDYEIKLPLYSYSFFDDYDHDRRFAFNLPISEIGVQTASSDQQCIEFARKKLRAYCGGLIEDVRDSNWNEYIEEKRERMTQSSKEREYPSEFNADFTHRSIPEFLERAEMQQNIKIYTKDFSAADCLSQLFLATLSQRKNREHAAEPASGIYPSLIYQIPTFLELRQDLDLDVAPFEFWEHFELVQGQRYPRLGINWKTSTIFAIEASIHSSFRILSCRIHEPENETVATPVPYSLLPPVYIAAHYGFIDYPLWKVTHDRGFVTDSQNLNLIVHLSLHCDRFRDHRSGTTTMCRTYELVQELLRQGYLNIHSSTDLWLKNAFEIRHPPATINIWHQYILRLMANKATAMVNGTVAQMTWVPFVEPIAAEMIETFLQLDGSPHLSMSWRSRIGTERSYGDEGIVLTYTEVCIEIEALSNGSMLSVQMEWSLSGDPESFHKMGKDYTFRQWVAEWPDDVAKKQNILHLIDRNRRPDFCPPSVEKQAMLLESALLRGEQPVEESSDDTIQVSGSPSSDEGDSKAAPLVGVTNEVESKSEESVETTSKVPLVAGQKATGANVTLTIAIFLLGVFTTVMLQLFLFAMAGKAK